MESGSHEIRRLESPSACSICFQQKLARLGRLQQWDRRWLVRQRETQLQRSERLARFRYSRAVSDYVLDTFAAIICSFLLSVTPMYMCTVQVPDQGSPHEATTADTFLEFM